MTSDQLRIYAATGSLLKDTNVYVSKNWFQTFSKGGSGVTINNTDTVAIYTYTISGSILKTYYNGADGPYGLQNISAVNSTNLKLESITVGSNFPSNWGLDSTKTYKFVEDDFFTKQ